ncbi:MAG: FAD-dependent oxidoreductase [Cytophagales bacterium]|nr:FAD-dependent oxidoreductase [Armatimonadota bacterium]
MPSLTVNPRAAFDVDVLVAGGGASGVAAALSAARAGARVLLIEKNGFLGGSATAAQVPAFAPFSDRTRAIVRGIGWEVLTQMSARMGRPIPDPDVYEVPQDKARMDWAPIDAEILKGLYDDLCEESGVEVLFHTLVPEVNLGDVSPESTAPPSPASRRRISAVLLANKNGLSLARARVFVDATGDADLAARAGCAFVQGDDGNRTQGMTLCFTVANGSREAYLGYVYKTGDGFLANLVAEARAAGDYDLPDASLVGLSFKSETVAGANMGHVYGFDPTDAHSLSLAERAGRRVVRKLLPFLRKYVPGQENLTLVSTGTQIGVRESRRIVGEYTLTLDDYLACRTFPDDIARSAYFIDLHAVTSESAARAKTISDAGDEKAERRHYALLPGQSHGIPYRCLLPRGVENLLVAGRSLSADRAVQGAVRVMPFCFAMGEAAGLAAAIAADHHEGRVRGVDISGLQARLRAQGAWLG